MGANGYTGLCVDEEQQKICLVTKHPRGVRFKVLSYRDILSSEVYEDGQSITKTARGSQLGGALIGGLALGGVGAIIGGLSGKKTASNQVSRIDLRVTVNDTSDPIHTVHFINAVVTANSPDYNSAIYQAQYWHGLMEVLIRNADSEDMEKEEKQPEEPPKALATGSVADELTKLAELTKQGVLTVEEFKAQKAKLLG